MPTPKIDIPMDRLADFCRRWKIVELSLFGSVLRDDFGPESDVDVLVSFADDAKVSLWDLFEAKSELAQLLERPVDLLTRPSVEQCGNPWKRHEILGSAWRVYAA